MVIFFIIINIIYFICIYLKKYIYFLNNVKKYILLVYNLKIFLFYYYYEPLFIINNNNNIIQICKPFFFSQPSENPCSKHTQEPIKFVFSFSFYLWTHLNDDDF